MTSELEGKNAKKRNNTRRRNLVPARTISVTDLDWDTFITALAQILSRGGAIRLGGTRDGGAWSVGIYGDGAVPYTEYVRPDEDINQYLVALGDFFRDMS